MSDYPRTPSVKAQGLIRDYIESAGSDRAIFDYIASLEDDVTDAIRGGLAGLPNGCSRGFACPYCGGGNSGYGLEHGVKCIVRRYSASV